MPPSGHPRVSVLIPNYNYARFLPEAIDSVLAQDFTDFELLISDDASTDDSAEIMRASAARDPRIRLQFHPANLGMIPHWNACLREARGEYIKYVFADDCLASRKTLGAMAAMLDGEPAVALAATGRLLLDENSRPTGIWNAFGPAGRYRGTAVITRCLQEDRNLIGEPSAVMFRRAAAGRGFDGRLRQAVDQELWMHLLEHGDLAYDPRPLCTFRRHSLQQTAANRRPDVGPEDSLLILARYLPQLAAGPGGFARRRILYRHLHYARRHAVRSPSVREAEAVLRAHLPFPWFPICWLWHRLSKPWVNLARWCRRPAAEPFNPQAFAEADLIDPDGSRPV
jgi:hypothetical protein